MGKAVKGAGTSRGGKRGGRQSAFSNEQIRPASRNLLDTAHGTEVIWQQVAPIFTVGALIAECQYVYFIGEPDNGPLKIGVAKDPIKRIRAMQTGNPRRLRIEYVLLGDRELEQLLHEYWEPFAIKSAKRRRNPDAAPGTEWFEPRLREELFPILATAVDRQLEYLYDFDGSELSFNALEKLVRVAHHDHDFTPKAREPVRLLARGAGYVHLERRSRI